MSSKKKPIIRISDILSAFKTIKGMLPYVGVALVLLILSLAVYAIYTYISNGLAKETVAYNWEYSYSDSADGQFDETNVRLFGSQTAIVIDRDVVRDYVFFRKTFDATEEPFNLVILTDHSPIRVYVNGEEIYNNHYGTASYVGNCYNAIRMGGTGKAQYVRVDMGLPFSVRFEPHSVEQSDLGLRPIAMGYVAAGFIALGFICAITAGIIAIIKKKTNLLFPAALYLVITGLCVASYAVPEMTYMLNAPIFFRLFNALRYAGLFSVAVFIAQGTSKKAIPVIAASGSAVVTFTLMMLISNKALFAYLYIVSGVLVAASLYFSAAQIYGRVKSRIQLAPTRFVCCIYLMTCGLFTAIFDVNRLALASYLPTAAIIVSSATFIYVKYTDMKVDEETHALIQLSARHSQSVANAASILHDMFDSKTERDFLLDTAGRIHSMLCAHNEQNTFCNFSVATRAGAEFEEIKNAGVTECNYRSIMRHCELRKTSYVYSGTYFAFTFAKNEITNAIIYFEGVYNVLDEFFISILLALYSGLDLIYQNIIGQNAKAAETSIFVQLARNIDIATGIPGEHIDRVSKYVYAVCRAMDLDDITSKSYALASKLHDIGKLAIPHSIIAKPSRFTDSERFIMKGHTDYGAIILSSYQGKPIFKLAAAIALYHHEQYGGKGYHGLAGENIPLCARITSVCDVFDALTTKRDYKDKWTFDAAYSYITSNSGTQFDPVVVEAFTKTLPVIKRICMKQGG